MPADTDAFAATDAGVGVFYLDVTVAEDVDFAKHLTGACVMALPAGTAVVRVDCDVCGLVTVAQSLEYSHTFFGANKQLSARPR
ncbi:MAG: hypothetical protein NC406_05800 [Bacteroides sp.]|nr:hypothetical protein [Bacteroides sp.]